LTDAVVAGILSGMWDAFGKHWEQQDEPRLDTEGELRLFPIVGRDLCVSVAALLARDRLEDAGRLIPDGAWVASAPLYG
jgi:hypothetical protein